MKVVSIKRTLVTSGLTLGMMVTMMAGASLAWFNQTIVNQGARIQSGNLTVEFLSDTDNDFSSGTTNLASTSDPIFQFGTNAQPGDFLQRYLRIKNTGSISMHYDMKFDVVLDTGLGPAIVVEVEKESATQSFTGVSIHNEVFSEDDALEADDSETYRVKLTFDSSAGNEFQNKAFNLDLYLVAYQASNVASQPIFVSTIGELTTAASAAVKGTSIVFLNSISASSTSLAFTELVNLNLRGFTLTLSSLSITSSDFGFMRFENGIMNLVNYTVSTPSATLTHAVNLTINVSGASSITVSNNTYVLIGVLQTVNLTVGGSTRFSPQSGSQLIVSGTITKDSSADIVPLSGAIISVPQSQLADITINPEFDIVVADNFVKIGQSIQAAINASEGGDIILVDAGVFNEEVFFNSISDRTLIGSKGAAQTVIAPTQAYAALGNNGITINLSHNITIRHLTIDGYANTVLGEVPTFRDGIHYLGPGEANHNTFENLIIKNIDRRGISVFPLTNTNTTIRNNHILNITGDVMGSWNGSVGINFQGSGVVENNLVEQVHTGLVYNSDISSEVTFTLRNNIIRNFKSVEDLSFFGAFNAGFNLWPRKTETIIIEDNLIQSSQSFTIGMYLNHFANTAIIESNILELTGDYVVGIDALNNKNGGYQIINNTVKVGSFSTALGLSTLGTVGLPMIIENNVLEMVGTTMPVATINAYEFNNFFFYQTATREVGILLSGSNETKRVKDTPSSTFASLEDNTITGFFEGVVVFKNATGNVALGENTFNNNGENSVVVSSD